ncbi:DnaB-like helicase C-terminal domain-containing protein [Candidatus Latescibacterota bacterium]
MTSLPEDQDLERRILAAMYRSEEAMVLAIECLQESDFTKGHLRRVYMALVCCYADGTRPGRDALLTRLPDANQWLSEVVDTLPTTSCPGRLGDAVERLRSISAARELITAAESVTAKARKDQKNIYELVEKLDRDLVTLGSRLQQGTVWPLEMVLSDAIERLDHRRQSPEAAGVVPSGIKSLDLLIDGWRSGTVSVIAGGSTGRTPELALGLAFCAVKPGNPLLLCTPGHRIEHIAESILADHSSVDCHRIANGDLNDADRRRIASAQKMLVDLPLYLDAAPYPSVLDVSARCNSMVASHGLRMVVIDNAALLRSRHGGPPERFGCVQAERLQALARASQVPVLITMPLPPNCSPAELLDLPNCEDYIAAVDTVLVLDEKESGAEVRVLYNRWGECGTAAVPDMRLSTADLPMTANGD